MTDASLADSLCAALADALFDSNDTLLPELAAGWLGSHLPTREYARAYVEPPPLVFTAPPTPTPAIKEEGSVLGKRVQMYDLLEHVKTGATTEAVNERADGSKTTVVSDMSNDTHVMLGESVHRALPLAAQLLTEHIFGAEPPPRTLVATLARLLVVLLLEPVCFEIDIELSRPVNDGAALALRVGARSTSEEERAEADRVFGAHWTSMTVHWFAGVAELGVPYRLLGPAALEAVAALVADADRWFVERRSEPTECHLARSRIDRRLDAALDRGRLVGGLARAFVALSAGRRETARHVARAAIDRAATTALDLVATPAGSRFSTAARVCEAAETARRLLAEAEIDDDESAQTTQTPMGEAEAIVAAIRARYEVASGATATRHAHRREE